MSVPLMKNWSISSTVLTQEAEELGLEVITISKSKNLFYIKGNGKEILFKSTDFGVNSSLGLKIANDKELTNEVLEKHSLPTAKSHYITPDEINILKDIDLKFPVIIKPLEEGHGDGVIMNILNTSELENKLIFSFKTYNRMIIQPQIEGNEYRILVYGNEVLVVVKREAASVIGDGEQTIQELIKDENKNILRSDSYNSPLSSIVIDDELEEYINKNKLSLNSIPQSEAKIQLRGNSNISTGGTYNNVTNITSDEIKNSCIESTKALGLTMAGIDVITTDISKNLEETSGVILEVNATPGIGGLTSIKGANIPYKILKSLFFNE